jgi:hypothetical protein
MNISLLHEQTEDIQRLQEIIQSMSKYDIKDIRDLALEFLPSLPQSYIDTLTLQSLEMKKPLYLYDIAIQHPNGMIQNPDGNWVSIMDVQ